MNEYISVETLGSVEPLRVLVGRESAYCPHADGVEPESGGEQLDLYRCVSCWATLSAASARNLGEQT